MRQTPTTLPQSDTRCPWWVEDAPLSPSDASVPAEVDCAIVGAGYAGLSCARRLAALRPDWTIVVVDALAVGQGAAGRNSGFVVDTGHWQPKLGVPGNRELVAVSRHGIGLLHAAVNEHAIACDWDDSGRYHVAVNARGRAAVEHFVDGLRSLNEPYSRVTPEALAEVLGTRYYTHAVHVPGGALVQPAALVRGLARSLPESVTLLERTPVTQIDPGEPVVLRTAAGPMRAQQLVIAANGFVGEWGIATGRVIPLLTFASVTPPLADPPGAARQWGAVPEERMGSTMRRTADGRILVRNGVVFSRRPTLGEPQIERMRTRHQASLVARFAELADVDMSHTWAGVLGVSINNGTCFGSLRPGAWVCAGFNGVGVALGTALGDLLAYEIVGQRHSLSAAAHRFPQPGWLPPSPLLGIGLRAYTGLLQWQAGTER